VREGRHTEAGEQEARPRANVVRLPRDWLGPREELVPFGPRASSEDAEEPPPSADDFWGERSAAIHDALEAPADSARVTAAARSLRRFDRRPRSTVIGGLAIALLVVIGIVSTVSGPGAARRPAGGSKVGVAAVFGSGVSRLLDLGLARLSTDLPRHPPSRADASHGHLAAHRPAPPRAHRRPHPQLSATPPVSIDTARATTTSSSAYAATSHVDTAPTYRSASSPPPSRPSGSAATVSPTGQSGALGPIQSPNG
jgi:hypothetical protein